MIARLMMLFEPEHPGTDEVKPAKSTHLPAHHVKTNLIKNLTCCGNMRALRPDGDVTRMRMVLDQIHQYRIPLLQALCAFHTLLLLA